MVDKFILDRRARGAASNDPSLPSSAPSHSLHKADVSMNAPKKKFIRHFYNRERKEYCGRTCSSWMYIIGYGIIYLMFLCTYTLVLLYLSLYLLKELVDFKNTEPAPLVYPIERVGLTATPTSESNLPLIWYKNGEKDDYEKYVQAIDRLLSSNRKNVDNLGPCGRPPYGYGDSPCVIIRINKQFKWLSKPLHLNSSVTKLAPPDVRKWIAMEKNSLWLECSGYHDYDKEHIGSIKYFPDPPGFESYALPLNKGVNSPLVAIQITDFTLGISLAVECRLWYENGPSTVDFVLYVAPNDSIAYMGQTNFND